MEEGNLKMKEAYYDKKFDKRLFLARHPPVGQGLLIYEDSRSHTTTHHSR